jgi:hypothetical protein
MATVVVIFVSVRLSAEWLSPESEIRHSRPDQQPH